MAKSHKRKKTTQPNKGNAAKRTKQQKANADVVKKLETPKAPKRKK